MSTTDDAGTFDRDEPGSAPRQEAVYQVEDEVTVYPEPGTEQETAQALLEAADDPRQVQFSEGAFIVPAAVAKKAKVPEGTPTGPALSQSQQDATLHGTKGKTAESKSKSAPAGRGSRQTKATGNQPAQAELQGQQGAEFAPGTDAHPVPVGEGEPGQAPGTDAASRPATTTPQKAPAKKAPAKKAAPHKR